VYRGTAICRGSNRHRLEEYASALNKYAVISACSIVFTLIVPFYKSLADKFGRRVFLAINTVGMALGLFVIMTARHPIMYGLGCA